MLAWQRRFSKQTAQTETEMTARIDAYSSAQVIVDAARRKPQCFALFGKPGCGKSTVAKTLAELLHCEIISASAVVEAAINTVRKERKEQIKVAKASERKRREEEGLPAEEEAEEENGEEEQQDEDEEPNPDKQCLVVLASETARHAYELAIDGKAIPPAVIQKLVEERVNAPETAFHGYVMEGFPVASDANDEAFSPKAQMDWLRTWTLQPDYVIDIRVHDEDVTKRRIGQRIDPITNRLYSQAELDQPSESADAEEEDDVFDPDAGDEGSESIDPFAPFKPTTFSIKPTPGPSAEVRHRLQLRPEDVRIIEQGNAELDAYKAQVRAVVEDYVASFHPQFRIELAGSLPLHLVIEGLMEQLKKFDIFAKIHPRILAPLGEEPDNDLDLIEALRKHSAEDESRPWKIGLFGVNCPVAFVEKHTVVKGVPTFVAVFQGAIYTFSSNENMLKFKHSPTRYLQAYLHAIGRFSVLGPSHIQADIQAVAARLSNAWSIPFVSQADIDSESLSSSSHLQQVQWLLAARPATLAEAQELVSSVYPLTHVIVLNLHEAEAELKELVEYIHAAGIAVVEVHAAQSEPSSAVDSHAIDRLFEQVHLAVNKAYLPLPSEAVHEYDEEDEATDPQFGDTKNYCPVALKDFNVLQPSNTDYAAMFRGMYYHLSSNEARALFIANPQAYAPDLFAPSVPAVRILLIGPTSSGKSVQGRKLSRRQRCFHISFQDRLKELAVTPEFQFREEVSQYILSPDENPLMSEHAIACVKNYWLQEPYRSSGFVLEGFPRNVEDVRGMCEAHLFVDLCVHLDASVKFILQRRLPKAFEKFEKVRNLEVERREAKAKVKASAKAERFKAWLQQKQVKKDTRAARKEALRLAGEEDEDDEVDDDDEEFVDELEEEEEDLPELEDPEAARERLTQEISEQHGLESSQLEEVVSALADDAKLTVAPVNGDRREEMVRTSFERLTAELVNFRSSRLASPRCIAVEEAEALINSGYKSLSAFGTWCPVQLFKGVAVQPTRRLRYPVVLREFVYYLASDENRKEFVINCENILRQASPPPVVALKLAVVGAPKSGKTTLANYFVAKYGCVRISIGSALRLVLDTYSHLHLAQRIREHLAAGGAVPDELSMEAVSFVASLPSSQVTGYVLDGFPLSKKQAEILSERYITPVNVIEIQLSLEEALKRSHAAFALTSNFHSHPENIANSVVTMRYNAFSRTIAEPRAWYTERHQNWAVVSGNVSKFRLHDTAHNVLTQSVFRQQTYLRKVFTSQAAAIAGLCITPDEVTARLSPFGLYCPVSWVERKQLVKSQQSDLSHAAEYQHKYYFLANEDAVESFLSSPQKYVSASVPASLPQQRSGGEVKASFPLQYALQGYCPVTFALGNQSYDSIQSGIPSLVVEFENKLFSFASEEKLSMFMRTPEKYANLVLPQKLPPRVEPINVMKLPMLGFMEQTCSTLVTQALTEVGLKRPKYPYLTATQSASIYFALILKARNPKSSDYAKSVYRKKLRAFEEKCEMLLYLGKNMSTTATTERPIDLDSKLSKFAVLGATASAPLR